MKLTAITGAAFVTMIALSAVPAQAQQRRENPNRPAQANRGGSVDRGQPVQRGQSVERSQPVQRAPSVDRGQQPVQRGPSVDRGQWVQRGQPADRGQAIVRGRAESSPPSRAYGDRQYGGVPRGEAVPRYGSPRVYERPGYERGRPVIVEPRRSYGYGSYGSYGYRPYAYTFRPRLRIGFGVFLGYPVPYPYYDPYAYPARIYGYPPAYGYPGSAYPADQRVVAYGGVSLEITPADATVSVDGTYVGVADDFLDPSRPLSLTPGRHRIQLGAPGYQPLVFDVDVQPGQVIPYRGDLQP
jgi:hypothetical protein